MRDRDEPLRCDLCEAEIGPGERVWRIGVMHSSGTAWGQRMENRCDDCRDDPGDGSHIPHFVPTPPEELGYEPGDVGWRDLGEPCEACGRPVLALHPAFKQTPPMYSDRSPPAVVCDDRCRHEAQLARQRERRAAERRTDCAECGETFTPARSDAKYCSGACRQRAYRKRKAG